MMSRAVNQSPCCFDCRGRGAAAKKARRSEGREVGHSEVSGSRGSGEERPQSPRERRGSAENKLATASQVRCADCGGSNSHESDGFRLSSGREKLKSIREPIKTAEEKLAASAARVLRPNSQEPDGFRPSRSRSFGRSLPLILRLHFQQRACGASHSRCSAIRSSPPLPAVPSSPKLGSRASQRQSGALARPRAPTFAPKIIPRAPKAPRRAPKFAPQIPPRAPKAPRRAPKAPRRAAKAPRRAPRAPRAFGKPEPRAALEPRRLAARQRLGGYRVPRDSNIP